MKFEEQDTGWSLLLERGQVQMIQIDFRLSLLVSDGPADKAWIHIERSCKLRRGSVDELLVPEKSVTLAPVLSLFGAEVCAVIISKVGGLEIKFGNDQCLVVGPDQTYEAWQLEGSCQECEFMLVCPPGGGVVAFENAGGPKSSVSLGLY